MALNTETIVPQLRRDFEALLDYVTGPESANHDVYRVELHLFRQLLALGAALLKLFFRTRAAARPETPTTSEGVAMRYHSRRSVRYISIFGELWVARHYFTAPRQAGAAPLDAELSLPDTAYSDLLRDWGAYGDTEQAYRETQLLLERMLGLTLSVATLEQQALRSAADVEAFYAQPSAPLAAEQSGSILVVQADGKGVPMTKAALEQPVRLGKGQKRGTKKEAVVTCLYSVAPYVRTAEEVAAALLHEGDPKALRPRPKPVAKEQHATLAGKAQACGDLAKRAAHRDGGHIQHRVALTDGAEALQDQMQACFPGYTLILDILHATEYLWDAANALVGETDPKRIDWLRPKLVQLLEGKTAEVIRSLQAEAAMPSRSESQRKALERTIGYYRRNEPFMHYDHYLAHGWPIGTGVVEGACGHLVKDRMEQAGMRWTVDGAQAILDLRAVRLNGDWDAYWHFHRQQQHHRLYGTPSTTTPEEKLFRQAA
jgi:hypothetical protein